MISEIKNRIIFFRQNSKIWLPKVVNKNQNTQTLKHSIIQQTIICDVKHTKRNHLCYNKICKTDNREQWLRVVLLWCLFLQRSKVEQREDQSLCPLISISLFSFVKSSLHVFYNDIISKKWRRESRTLSAVMKYCFVTKNVYSCCWQSSLSSVTIRSLFLHKKKRTWKRSLVAKRPNSISPSSLILYFNSIFVFWLNSKLVWSHHFTCLKWLLFWLLMVMITTVTRYWNEKDTSIPFFKTVNIAWINFWN